MPTTKPTTTLAESTTAATTAAETVTAEQTTAIFETYTAEMQTEMPVYSSVGYTEKKEEKKSKKATVPLASACGVSASGVAVLAVLIKKKSEE